MLQILKDHQLYAKFRKSEFLVSSIAFIGHIVSKGGIEIDTKKTGTVKKCPRPHFVSNI